MIQPSIIPDFWLRYNSFFHQSDSSISIFSLITICTSFDYFCNISWSSSWLCDKIQQDRITQSSTANPPNKEEGASHANQDHQVIIDSNHPLYLTPSDTLWLSLVFVQLTRSDNYSIWSRGVLVALLAKNKLGFINGTCKREDLDPSLHHLWDRYNAFAFGWIMNAVSRDILSTIIYSTSAFLVWKDLNERFNKVNGSRIFQLHREIAFTTQGFESIIIYFGRLKLVWVNFQQFAIFQPGTVKSSRLIFHTRTTSNCFNFLWIKTNLIVM